MAFTTLAAAVQHWTGKAPSLSKERWVKQTLGAGKSGTGPKHQYSSFKITGVQLRGKRGAQIQLIYK
jgi:hypothetical protein